MKVSLKDFFRRHSTNDPTVLTEDQKKAEKAKMEAILDAAETDTVSYQRELTPLQEAVKNDDIKRLISYAKDFTSKMTPEVLSEVFPFVSSFKAFDILTSFAPAPSSKQTILTIAKNMMERLKPNKADADTLKFFKANDISMNFRYQKDPFNPLSEISLYDYAKDKKDWVALATESEINQELKSFLISENNKKVKELFKLVNVLQKSIDLSAKDEDGLTVMSHAHDPKNILFLYENGGKLHEDDSSGLNAFERIGKNNQKELLLKCLENGDVIGLASAVKAGIPLNDTSYLLKTKNPYALAFLASRGASIDDAMHSLGNSKEAKKQIWRLQSAKGIIAENEKIKLEMTPERKKELEHEFRQAVINGRKRRVLKMLTEYAGILNIDAQNKNGVTALMYAAHINDIGMINLLSQFGASPLVQDKEGKNFFNYIGTTLVSNTLLGKYIDEGNINGLKAVADSNYPYSYSFIERAKLNNKKSYEFLNGKTDYSDITRTQIINNKQKTAR